MTRILATFLLNKRRFLTKIGDPFLCISGNHQLVMIAVKKFDTECFFRIYFILMTVLSRFYSVLTKIGSR